MSLYGDDGSSTLSSAHQANFYVFILLFFIDKLLICLKFLHIYVMQFAELVCWLLYILPHCT